MVPGASLQPLMQLEKKSGRHDTQHNDNEYKISILLCWVSFMLGVANKSIMLGVVVLNVVMISVMAQWLAEAKTLAYYNKELITVVKITGHTPGGNAWAYLWVESHLKKVELTCSENHSSLLQYGANYGGKNLKEGPPTANPRSLPLSGVQYKLN